MPRSATDERRGAGGAEVGVAAAGVVGATRAGIGANGFAGGESRSAERVPRRRRLMAEAERGSENASDTKLGYATLTLIVFTVWACLYTYTREKYKRGREYTTAQRPRSAIHAGRTCSYRDAVSDPRDQGVGVILLYVTELVACGVITGE